MASGPPRPVFPVHRRVRVTGGEKYISVQHTPFCAPQVGHCLGSPLRHADDESTPKKSDDAYNTVGFYSSQMFTIYIPYFSLLDNVA